MKKKYKLKKSRILLFVLVLFIIILFLIFNRSKSYTLAYDIADFKINESYDKKNEVYYFEVEKDELKFNFVIEQKYLKDRELIKNVNEKKYKNFTCYLINSNYFETNPLCKEDNTIIDYHLIPSKFKAEVSPQIYTKTINKEINNYQIKALKNNILIWNYKGFNYLSENKVENITLFKKDIYNISLATLINDYIFIPDYDQDYNFDEAYVINLKNFSKEKWKLDYEISYESYIVGTNDKSIFLIDKKNKLEYELVPHRKKMRIVGTASKKGIIYQNGKQVKKSLLTISNNEKSFIYKNNYHFTLKDNTLYLSYLDSKIMTKISNRNIKKIVNIDNDNIYYISESTLYFYNLKYGETKSITYSEWEFNYNNMIFIYN